MIDGLIDFLIELAVNPDAQISDEMLDRYQIRDDNLRTALLNKDKHALMRFLDAKRSPLTMSNNGAIYAISGDIETLPPGQRTNVTSSGDIEAKLSDQGADVTFVLKSETEYDLTMTNIRRPDDKYKARVVSGELMGRQIPPSREVEAPEEETL